MADQQQRVITRIRVVATSLITWITFGAAAVAIIGAVLADMIGVEHPVVLWLGGAGIWLTAVVLIIQRVTAVLPAAQGLLPPSSNATPWTERELIVTNVLMHPARGSDPAG